MKKSDREYVKTFTKRFSDKFSRSRSGGMKSFNSVKEGVEETTEELFYIEQAPLTIGTTTAYVLPFGVDLKGRILTDGVRLYTNEIGEDGSSCAFDINDPSINLWIGGDQYGEYNCCDGNLYFVCNSDTGNIGSYNLSDGTLVNSVSPGNGGSYDLASNGNRIASLFSGIIWIADSSDFSSITQINDINVKINSSMCISSDRLYYTSYDDVANSYIKSISLVDGSSIDSVNLTPVTFSFKSSLCTDGELVFAQYEEIGPVVCCYTKDLNLVWSRSVSTYSNFIVDDKYLYYMDNIGGLLSNLVILDKYYGTEVWRSDDYPEITSQFPCTDGYNVFIIYYGGGANYIVRKFSTGKSPVYMKVSGTDSQRKPMFNPAVPL